MKILASYVGSSLDPDELHKPPTIAWRGSSAKVAKAAITRAAPAGKALLQDEGTAVDSMTLRVHMPK